MDLISVIMSHHLGKFVIPVKIIFKGLDIKPNLNWINNQQKIGTKLKIKIIPMNSCNTVPHDMKSYKLQREFL